MWKVVLIPVLSILLVWAWQFLNWVWIRPKKIERMFRQQGMKGRPYKFLFGSSKESDAMYQESYSKPLGLADDIIPRVMPDILDTVTKYGNFSFMWSGPRPRVFVLDPALIKEMMNKHQIFGKPYKVTNHINQKLITGLALMEGQTWATSRTKLNPNFHTDTLKGIVPAIQGCCMDVINQWIKIAVNDGGSSTINVSKYLGVFTSSVVGKLMFGSAYTDRIKETFFQLSEMSNLGKVARYSVVLPGEKYFPTKINQRAKEIENFVRASFTSMINERLEERQRSGEYGKSNLFDIFMEEFYEKKDLSRKDRERIIEEIIGQCKIFFFGGYETTSNALCWTLIHLSIHQEWQNRAREEVFKVLGDKRDMTSDDLVKLKIVTMIAHEMMRYHPGNIELSRLVTEDTKLGGYYLPKDTLVTLPLLIVQRSKEIWGETAAEFHPERFAEGVAKATNNSERVYMPFGWGPRMCIAQNLALVEMKVFLANLLREFSFDLSPTYVHAPCADAAIYPQYGAPLIMKKL